VDRALRSARWSRTKTCCVKGDDLDRPAVIPRRAARLGRDRARVAWRDGRAASMSSGVKRCTHRYTVTWSTSTPRSGEQFLDVAVRRRVAQVPANRHDDHVRREPVEDRVVDLAGDIVH
jgi:hypothetical protein